jgi:transcription elongation factor Elf1
MLTTDALHLQLAGLVKVTYTCPRCGKQQTKLLPVELLQAGYVFCCACTEYPLFNFSLPVTTYALAR